MYKPTMSSSFSTNLRLLDTLNPHISESAHKVRLQTLGTPVIGCSNGSRPLACSAWSVQSAAPHQLSLVGHRAVGPAQFQLIGSGHNAHATVRPEHGQSRVGLQSLSFAVHWPSATRFGAVPSAATVVYADIATSRHQARLCAGADGEYPAHGGRASQSGTVWARREHGALRHRRIVRIGLTRLVTVAHGVFVGHIPGAFHHYHNDATNRQREYCRPIKQQQA